MCQSKVKRFYVMRSNDIGLDYLRYHSTVRNEEREERVGVENLDERTRG